MIPVIVTEMALIFNVLATSGKPKACRFDKAGVLNNKYICSRIRRCQIGWGCVEMAGVRQAVKALPGVCESWVITLLPKTDPGTWVNRKWFREGERRRGNR